MIPARIVVRTATPWETMTFADFMNQSDPGLTGMAKEEIQRNRGAMIRKWQAAYGLDFCHYRSRVRDACQATLERIPDVAITIGMERFFSNGWNRDPDEWLFPIDDDDTFDDSITSLPALAGDAYNLILWQRRTNYLGQDRFEQGSQFTDTCNYAIRKSWLATFSFPDAADILGYHWIAGGKIATRLGLMAHGRPLLGNIGAMLENVRKPALLGGIKHPTVLHLGTTHSTYYLHTGSISFLVGGKMAKHEDTTDYLRGLPLHPLYRG